ncbi:MAG: hypothetical protein U0269_22070 [Polyangiales bacterium]
MTAARDASTSRALRFVMTLAMPTLGAARGCSLGARPICEPATYASMPAAPWGGDAAVYDAALVQVHPMRCYYSGGAGPLPPPSLDA